MVSVMVRPAFSYTLEGMNEERDENGEVGEELMISRQETCMVSRACIHPSTSAAGKSSRMRCMRRERIWLVNYGM